MKIYSQSDIFLYRLPYKLPHQHPNRPSRSVGYLCLCLFWPFVLVFLAHTRTQNHHPSTNHQPKKSVAAIFVRPTQILFSRPPHLHPSFHLLHLFLPLSSPHTRANSHPRCQRQATRASSSSSSPSSTRDIIGIQFSVIFKHQNSANQQNFERGLPDLRTDGLRTKTTDHRQSKRLLSEAFSVLGR